MGGPVGKPAGGGETYVFPFGIPAFEQFKFFQLTVIDGDGTVALLESVQDPHVGFVLIDPQRVTSEYHPEPTAEELATIGLESLSDGLVYAICTPRAAPEDTTVNLRAPVLINPRLHLGRQVVLLDAAWPVRHPLPALDDRAEVCR